MPAARALGTVARPTPVSLSPRFASASRPVASFAMSSSSRNDKTLLTFDVDGTLIRAVGTDANKFHKNAFAHAMREHHGIDTHIDVIKHHGSTDQLVAADVLRFHGVEEDAIWSKMPAVCASMVEFAPPTRRTPRRDSRSSRASRPSSKHSPRATIAWWPSSRETSNPSRGRRCDDSASATSSPRRDSEDSDRTTSTARNSSPSRSDDARRRQARQSARSPIVCTSAIPRTTSRRRRKPAPSRSRSPPAYSRATSWKRAWRTRRDEGSSWKDSRTQKPSSKRAG